MGRKITAKKDQTDGALMMAAYTESEYEKEILALEGSETLAEAEAYAEPEDKNTLSVSTITLGKETKSQISEDETSHNELPATSKIGGIDVFFYKKEGSSYFSLHLNKNNVSYTLQADTPRKVAGSSRYDLRHGHSHSCGLIDKIFECVTLHLIFRLKE